MTRRIFFILLAAALTLNAKEPGIVSDPKFAGIPQAMQKFVEDGSLSGSVTLLARDGKVLSFEAVGLADIATKKPMERDSVFWIASMTKPMTALGVMMLQEEGKLSLDDPIEKHLPEFKGQLMVKEKSAEQTVLVKPARPVTIKDLLTHTSGLVSASPLDGDALDVLSLKEAVITYALSPLQFEPGSKWSYCNPGINTLGRLIEVASGEEYADFMEKRIFKPLGMRHTTFWPDKKELSRLATSYKPAADGKALEPVGIRYLTPPFSNKKRAPLAPHQGRDAPAHGHESHRRAEGGLLRWHGHGTGLSSRATADGGDRDAFAGDLRSWRCPRHTGLDRSHDEDDLHPAHSAHRPEAHRRCFCHAPGLPGSRRRGDEVAHAFSNRRQ